MGAQILPEALTYYRLHEGNSFQLAGHDAQKLRHKQKSLAILAKSLSRQLEIIGVEPEVCRTVVEYTQASADQLRLVLDGGWPWETVKTEWTIYDILHPEAPFSHRAFIFWQKRQIWSKEALKMDERPTPAGLAGVK